MKSRMLFFFLLIAAWPFSLLADDSHSHLAPGEKLGNVTFPISCATQVQKTFERGMALMHSFEYESAENQFKEIARQDPGCAMAYWGQALSLYHQLWSRPSKADLKRGSDLLAHAKELKPKTERENEYLNALAAFYHDSDKIDHRERAAAYSAAMEGVYRHNPKDLSLIHISEPTRH